MVGPGFLRHHEVTGSHHRGADRGPSGAAGAVEVMTVGATGSVRPGWFLEVPSVRRYVRAQKSPVPEPWTSLLGKT